MAKFRTLDSLDPKGKRILLRADLNLPVKDGRITDRTRIDRLSPTIAELADKGGRVIADCSGEVAGEPRVSRTSRCCCPPPSVTASCRWKVRSSLLFLHCCGRGF